MAILSFFLLAGPWVLAEYTAAQNKNIHSLARVYVASRVSAELIRARSGLSP